MLILPWLRVLYQADDGTDLPNNDQDPPDPKPDPEDDPYDKERAMKLINKQRDEIKALKASSKDLPDLKKKLEDLENKDKSESERAIARAESAEKRAIELESGNTALTNTVKRRVAIMAIRNEAVKQGADDDLVAALVDLSKIEFDTDDDDDPIGTPKDIKKIVKAIIDTKPAVLVGEQHKNGPKPSPEKTEGDVISKEVATQVARQYTRMF